jgi:hypothetical protein
VTESILRIRATGRLPIGLSRWEQESLELQLSADAYATISSVNSLISRTNADMPTLSVLRHYRVPSLWRQLLCDLEEGSWPGGYSPDVANSFVFDYLPNDMQTFIRDAVATLREHLDGVYGLLRWRWSRELEPGRPIQASEFTWSLTGDKWSHLPQRLEISAHLAPQLRLRPYLSGSLQGLATLGEREPLGRQIWHAATQVDPRTSIVLAVTAVEVELKRLIGALVPQADWLVANAPSPPIHKIIRNYLPTLPRSVEYAEPPPQLLRALEKAVALRNKFVHVGPGPSTAWLAPDPSALEANHILRATSDLLWLFDVQRGHAWALDHLSDETRELLGLTSTPPP